MELDLEEITDPFLPSVRPLADLELRAGFTLTQIPSPKGIAPQSIAFAIEVDHDQGSDHGVSRLVFCFDEDQPEGWNSTLRAIGYAKSPIELEMAKDDYLSELPWQWLTDSLRAGNADFAHEAGTTTTVVSTGHGSLVAQAQHAELEIRASWAPIGDLRQHVIAWVELLALISGLPPQREGVARIK